MKQSTKNAIRYIETCRNIHQDWVEWQNLGFLTKEQLRIGGGKTHHNLWIHRYNKVIEELERLSEH